MDVIEYRDERIMPDAVSEEDSIRLSATYDSIVSDNDEIDIAAAKPTCSPFFNFWWKSTKPNENHDSFQDMKNTLRDFTPLACGAIDLTNNVYNLHSKKPNSAIGSQRPSSPYTETTNRKNVDPRMPGWIAEITKEKEGNEPLSQFFYTLGKSRTMILHQIVRGNWTWCTAWSPDGNRLAIATENHHIAVLETSTSSIWRVRHDQRMTKSHGNETTQSIRAIAWGRQFIAIGGTGNVVSILSTIEPYPIVHTIKGTGFVGSLDWRLNSSILAIGSREEFCSLFKVSVSQENSGGNLGAIQRVFSEEICRVKRADWVNVVSFSPGGSMLAIGENNGKLSIYSFDGPFHQAPKLGIVKTLDFDSSILDVEWSPDGSWLYAGGEGFAINIIDTSTWQVKKKLHRERWIEFIASSNKGTHVAVGGGSSEVAILDVQNDWKTVWSIETEGLVPLSAKWHPRDQFLTLTGQDSTILAFETTNARQIKGLFLRSAFEITSVEFSPDGQILAVGNEDGKCSFYRSDGTSFVAAYEVSLGGLRIQTIVWSPNGSYVVIGGDKTLLIVGQEQEIDLNTNLPLRASTFGIRKMIRNTMLFNQINIHVHCRYIAMTGGALTILDAGNDFKCINQFELGKLKACAWSLDGTWLATTGESNDLMILDTSHDVVANWKKVFTLDCSDAGNALAWGPTVVDGLQYLAYGGANKAVTIIEIRTLEGTWETVLRVDQKGVINDLDWNNNGLLAIAIGDGTATIIDLAYLKSGCAVYEMDYNWQRQGITCSTEIRRNRGENQMTTLRWIPSSSSNESLLAIGGSDGVLEVIDLTERSFCKGFANSGNDLQNTV
jgi:WD40 repeat protein